MRDVLTEDVTDSFLVQKPKMRRDSEDAQKLKIFG